MILCDQLTKIFSLVHDLMGKESFGPRKKHQVVGRMRLAALESGTQKFWSCAWKKTNVIFTHLSVNESLVHLCLSNLTHLTILFCPSEKEIDFFTAPLVFKERSIGVGSFVVQLWRSSLSSLTGRQEEEDSRSIPESMLPPSPLPTSTPLPPPPKPPPCRLVLAPTHRRSLVFRLDLPSPLSLSLFASRSTTVELSRVGLWVSARVNEDILEIFDGCSPNSRFWRWPWDLGVSEAKDQVFRSSEYICLSLSSIKILGHKVSVSVAGLCSALCPEKLTCSSIESNAHGTRRWFLKNKIHHHFRQAF